MPTHLVESIIDGQPTFAVPLDAILAELQIGGALKTLTPLEYHTEQQRRWYKGVCLKGLSDWNGDTPEEWDLRLKADCGGNELLNRDTILARFRRSGTPLLCDRLTIVGVGKKNMTAFIENILSRAIEMDWPVTPPDPELRR